MNALLRYLTEDTNPSETAAFLLAYRSVATPFSVLSRLIERYRTVNEAPSSAAEKARVRDAVSALVVAWAEDYPEDFEDQAMVKILTDLHRLLDPTPINKIAEQLHEACV